MNSKMLRFANKLEVLNRIIQRVTIPMVYRHSGWHLPMLLHPNKAAIQNPLVWFGNLDVLPLFALSLVATDSANIATSIGRSTTNKLALSVSFHCLIITPNYVGGN